MPRPVLDTKSHEAVIEVRLFYDMMAMWKNGEELENS